MSEHLNNKVLGGLLCFVVFLGVWFLSPVVPQNLYADEVQLKEIQPLGSRLRERIVSYRLDRGRGGLEYNISILNLGRDPIYPPIRVVADSISLPDVTLDSPDGQVDGKDYIELDASYLSDGVLDPDEQISGVVIFFKNPSQQKFTFDLTFQGCMEMQEQTFASVGVNPRSTLPAISLKNVSMRLDRVRGGVEYQVKIKNDGADTLYGPMRLIIDSINGVGVEFSEAYGLTEDGKPYVVVENYLSDNTLPPGAESEPFWLFFSNPQNIRFRFQAETAGYSGYYVDITNSVELTVAETLRELGVSTFNVSIKNTVDTAFEGRIRLKVNSITVGGVEHTTGLSGMMQSSDGLAGQSPYLWTVEDGILFATDDTSSVQMVVNNLNEEDITLNVSVEALYQGLPAQTSVDVAVDSILPDAANNETTYLLTLTNNSSASIVSPMILVVDAISESGVSVKNPSGYIEGKPFIEITRESGSLNVGAATDQIEIVFDNPDQLSFTPSFSVQAAQSSAVVDTTAPVTTHNYALPNIWSSQDASITLSATDDMSGVKETHYIINNGNDTIGTQIDILTEGQTFLEFYSVDNADNVEAIQLVVVKIDKSAPATTSTYTQSGQWVNQNVSFTLSATDVYSQVKETYFSIDSGAPQTGQTVSVSDEGEHVIEYWSVDYVDNQEEKKNVLVKLDKTAPVSADDFDGEIAIGSLTIHINATDNLSGVAQTKFSINGGSAQNGSTITLATNGDYSIEYWSIDTAGNQEAHKQIQASVSTPPTFSVTFPESGYSTSNSTITISGEIEDPTATIMVGDTVGVVNGNQFEIPNVPLEEGEIFYTIEAENPAGLTKSVFLRIIKDSIPPEIEITSPSNGDVISADTITIQGSVEDEAVALFIEATDGGDDQEITIDNDGTFVVSGLSLPNEGINEILFYAVDELGNNHKDMGTQVSLTLYRDTSAPDYTLQVALYDAAGNPKDPQTVSGTEVTLYNQVMKLDIMGQVLESDSVVIINSQELPLDNDGHFSLQGLTFTNVQEGQSVVITVAVKDAVFNLVQTEITLIKDTTGPEIFITGQASGAITNDPTARTIQGVARGTTEVIANGTPIPVANQRFSVPGWVLSEEGANILELRGYDAIGNETHVSFVMILDTDAPAPVSIITPALSPYYMNQPSVSVYGTGETGANISITGGTIDAETSVLANGFFTSSVYVNTNTTNYLVVTQSDAAGNQSSPQTVTVIHDNVKPTLTLVSPSATQLETDKILVSGGVSDNKALMSTVKLNLLHAIDNSLVSSVDVAIANGQFSYLLTLSAEGDYKLEVIATDKASNTKKVTRSFNYTEVVDDFEGPELIIITPLHNSYTNQPTVTVTGTCIDRSSIPSLSLALDSGAFSPVDMYDNDTGAFSHQLTLSSDNPYVVTVKAIDGSVNANESTASSTVILDTEPPLTAPAVSGISPGIDVGDGSFLAKVDKVKVIGSYEPGYTVEVSSDLQTVSGMVDGTGLFTIEVNINTSNQQNVDNIITAVGIDKAGNRSTDTNPDLFSTITVTYDGIKPSVTAVDPANGVTGVDRNAVITIYFSESISISSLSESQGNRIYVRDSQNAIINGTITPVEDSLDREFLFSLDNDSYPDGEVLTVVIDKKIHDLAGNTLANNVTSSFTTVDETAPDTPVITSVSPGYLTNAMVVHVIGTCEPNATILAYRDNDTLGLVGANASGTFDIEVSLLENQENIFTLIARDASSNESDETDPISVVQDNVQPQLLSVNPEETAQNILKNSVFEFEFDETLNAATIQNGFTITGKNNRVVGGSVTSIDNTDGVLQAGFRFSPSNLLMDGETINITLTNGIHDFAGNSPDFSAETNNVKVIIYTVEDLEAPAAPVITSVSEESLTNSATIDVAGTAEPGVTVKINGGGLTSAGLQLLTDAMTGAFNATIPLKQNSANTIAFKAVDAAGNSSGVTSVQIVNDTAAPKLTNVIPSEGSEIPVSGLFTMIFNEAIDQTTIQSSIKLMAGVSTVPVTFSINEAGTIVTIKAVETLSSNFAYTLSLAPTLKDLAGNNYSKSESFTYLTDDPIIPNEPIIATMSQTSPTNATMITVTGYGSSDGLSKVYALDQHGADLAMADIDDVGEFSINIPLQIDTLNAITLVCRRPSGNKSAAVTIKILQDSTPPEVEILTPKETLTLPATTVTLVAQISDASPISSCMVNGVEKVLNIDASHYLNTVLTDLYDGMIVELIVTDSVGLQTTQSITLAVNPEDPETETSPPLITFIYPPDGMQYDGSTIDVSGTVEDANEISSVTVNGVAVDIPEAFPTSAAYFKGKIGLVDGNNIITVTASDIKNNLAQESISIFVDVAPPSIYISSPANEAVFLGSNVTVSGLVTDSNGISEVKLNGSTISIDQSGAFSVVVSLDEGENTLIFEAIDVADNVTVKQLILYYDVEGPKVIEMHPKDGAVEVSSGTEVYAIFSERLDPQTVSTSTVKLIYIDEAGDEATELTGNVVLEGKKVFFAPDVILEPGATYRFKIGSGIKDLVGFDLQEQRRSSFTIDEEITAISGTVNDIISAEGVKNATVRILGTDIETKTDSIGNFYLEYAGIPVGNQVIYIDASSAEFIEPGVSFHSTYKSVYLESNTLNDIPGTFYMPRIRQDSVVQINGLEEQIVDFNGTITGIIESFDKEFGYFSMTVPAGALEFPNGSTSGALAARQVHETFLPKPRLDGMEVSMMSCIWFDPFVKCNEPVHIELPIMRYSEGFNVGPGEHFFIMSYNSETADWDEVGLGTISEDGKRIVLDEGAGLNELTIVAIFPYNFPEEALAELNSVYKVGAGGSEGNFGNLIEAMIVINIMSMMSPISSVSWRVGYWEGEYNYGGEGFFGLAGVRVDVNGKISWSSDNPDPYRRGRTFHRHYFPVAPILVWLMCLLDMWIAVQPSIDIAYTGYNQYGNRQLRHHMIWGINQEHHVMLGGFAPQNARIYVDFWALNGNVRVIGDDGQADTSVTGTPKVYIYAEMNGWANGAGGRVELNGLEGLPVLSVDANAAPMEENPTNPWYKSYHGTAWGGFMPTRQTVVAPEGDTYQVWQTFVRPGSTVRILGKLEQGSTVYTGEVYTKANENIIVDAGTGQVGNVDMYTNLSIGRLNVDTYVIRNYARDGQVVSQVLPFRGLSSANDLTLNLHSGTALFNGDKTPTQSAVVYGLVEGTDGGSFNINANSDSPWMAVSPSAGAYKVEISPYKNSFDPEDLLLINIKSNQAATPSVTDPEPAEEPAVTRATSTRGSSSRGNYVTPRTTTQTATRRTPAPSESTLRKGYVWFVLSTLMFNENNINDHCEAEIKYYDWSTWYDHWDPDMTPTAEDKSLFPPLLTSRDDIKLKFDTQTETPLSLTIKFKAPSNSTQIINVQGTDGSLSTESYSLLDDGEVVVKITQLGTPYVLRQKLKEDFAKLLTDSDPRNDNQIYDGFQFNVEGGSSVLDAPTIRGMTNTISEFFLIDIGSLSNLDEIRFIFMPELHDSYGVPEIIKYLDHIESYLMASFVSRQIMIEIIDKQTLRPEENYIWTGSGPSAPSLDFDPTDSVYNQLERMIIHIK